MLPPRLRPPTLPSLPPPHSLRAALTALSPQEIIQFRLDFDHHMQLANRWDLRDAATILIQSPRARPAFTSFDDRTFEHFRAWLIAHGQPTYDLVLADPDNLATLPIRNPADCYFQDFLYAAAYAYDMTVGRDIGEELPPYTPPVTTGAHLEDPSALAARFPRITHRWHRG